MAQPFIYAETILGMTTGQSTTKTGDRVELETIHGDGVNDVDQRFVFHFFIVHSGGASSPTTIAKVQHSVDGTNWIDLVTATTITTDTTGTVEVKDTTNITSPVFRYLRGVVTVGGGTAPSSYAVIKMVSNAAFRLQAR